MADLRVAFYRGTRPGIAGLYNRLVRIWEKGPYSHCELVFANGIAASASYMDGGVRFKQIEFDAERWDFVDVKGMVEDGPWKWFVAHMGAPYDLLGNVHFLLGPVPDDKRKWFCSEAVGAALGMPEAWRYGPNALAAVLRYWQEQSVQPGAT